MRIIEIARKIVRASYRFIPDELYIRWIFYRRMNYKLNLKKPETYNEKLQWIKLYDRDPIYTTIVDKYAAKEYIGNKIGYEYVIPTLGVWNKFDEIDFSSLPDKFVLKTTHDSGGVVICKDKITFDKKAAKRILNSSLRHDYYLNGREWPYKNVPRRIIAEAYLEDSKLGELRDYKFYCFRGDVKIVNVVTGRQEGSNICFDFYDCDFNHLDIKRGHPNSNRVIEKPNSFDEMIKLASILSKPFKELRVDFYEVDGKPYVGELTLFSSGGWLKFEPDIWDKKLGDCIKLPIDEEV